MAVERRIGREHIVLVDLDVEDQHVVVVFRGFQKRQSVDRLGELDGERLLPIVALVRVEAGAEDFSAAAPLRRPRLVRAIGRALELDAGVLIVNRVVVVQAIEVDRRVVPLDKRNVRRGRRAVGRDANGRAPPLPLAGAA